MPPVGAIGDLLALATQADRVIGPVPRESARFRRSQSCRTATTATGQVHVNRMVSARGPHRRHQSSANSGRGRARLKFDCDGKANAPQVIRDSDGGDVANPGHG